MDNLIIYLKQNKFISDECVVLIVKGVDDNIYLMERRNHEKDIPHIRDDRFGRLWMD